MPEQYFIRKSLIDLEQEPKYIWQDDAACAFSDPDLFMVTDVGLPLEGETGDQYKKRVTRVRRFNKSKFKKAGKICSTCPVKGMCESEATQEDLDNTFRAGQAPTGYRLTANSTSFKADPSNPPKPKPTPKGGPRRPNICKRNHDPANWTFRPNGTRACKECVREARGIKGRAARIDPEKPCQRGHLDWMKYGGARVRYYCRTCRNLNRQQKKLDRLAS